MIIKEAFEKVPMLQKMNDETKDLILTCATIRTYQKGEFVFMDKEEVNQVYFVVKGYVSVFKVNKKLDKKVIFIYGSGDLLNEVILQEPIASVSCETLSEVTVLAFKRKSFLAFLEQDFILSKAVMDSMALKVRRLYHQLGNTSNMMNLEKQVASKLWKLARDFGVTDKNELQINFDLSITFLADMIGSKRESISRVVKCLTEKEIIKIQKNRFYICDKERLIQVIKSEKGI